MRRILYFDLLIEQESNNNATLLEALFARSDSRGTSNQVDGDNTPLFDKVDRMLTMGGRVDACSYSLILLNSE